MRIYLSNLKIQIYLNFRIYLWFVSKSNACSKFSFFYVGDIFQIYRSLSLIRSLTYFLLCLWCNVPLDERTFTFHSVAALLKKFTSGKYYLTQNDYHKKCSLYNWLI